MHGQLAEVTLRHGCARLHMEIFNFEMAATTWTSTSFGLKVDYKLF